MTALCNIFSNLHTTMINIRTGEKLIVIVQRCCHYRSRLFCIVAMVLVAKATRCQLVAIGKRQTSGLRTKKTHMSTLFYSYISFNIEIASLVLQCSIRLSMKQILETACKYICKFTFSLISKQHLLDFELVSETLRRFSEIPQKCLIKVII